MRRPFALYFKVKSAVLYIASCIFMKYNKQIIRLLYSVSTLKFVEKATYSFCNFAAILKAFLRGYSQTSLNKAYKRNIVITFAF